MLKKLPKEVSLGAFRFQIEGFTESNRKHPWAGQSNFAELSAGFADFAENQITMEFSSPTAFRSNENDIPLPIPDQIYRSYWTKWNSYAPAPLKIDKAFIHFVKDCVIVEHFEISTTPWSLPDGGWDAATGF